MRLMVLGLQKAIFYLAQSWYALAMLIFLGIWSAAWLAPLSIFLGYTDVGQSLYAYLAPHDHQLPQRSYFLFGEEQFIQSYNETSLIALGADPLAWRHFIGNAETGYKTAMNFRMMAIFSGLLLGGGLWPWLRHRLNLVYISLFLLPMLIDAISHRQSELGSGFREGNIWAQRLSFQLFSDNFYQGTQIASLNWFLRTGTGFLFGFAVVMLLFTYLDKNFEQIKRQLRQRWGLNPVA